jgi:predicted phosphoribosyltransferase/YHS domain-containing protein
MIFQDRYDAGRALAVLLHKYAGRPDVEVLALPRGGVPVAYEVAKAIHAPFDVFVVRKVGVPGNEEFAMGAVASGGTRYIDRSVVRTLDLDEQTIEHLFAREEAELFRRESLYREGRSSATLHGKAVILVDDGLATGATMRAAIQALRQKQPSWIVVAVPAGSPDTCREIGAEVDEVYCAATPEPFYAVGQWYRDFSQISDDEVRALLSRGSANAAVSPDERSTLVQQKDPVCGMNVDSNQAEDTSDYQGKTYYFCSEDCKQRFDEDPKQFTRRQEEPAA